MYCCDVVSTSAIVASVSSTRFAISSASCFNVSRWVIMLSSSRMRPFASFSADNSDFSSWRSLSRNSPASTEQRNASHIHKQITGKDRETHACIDSDINPLTPQGQKTGFSYHSNSRKAEILDCRSLIYSHKAEMSAWKLRKKLLQRMLCLGAPGLGTPCCGSSGVRGLTEVVNQLHI